MTGREAKAVTGGTHSPNRPGFPIVIGVKSKSL